jgi:hypothetical protein
MIYEILIYQSLNWQNISKIESPSISISTGALAIWGEIHFAIRFNRLNLQHCIYVRYEMEVKFNTNSNDSNFNFERLL